MVKKSSLTIPEGATFKASDDGVAIHYDGDAHILSTLGQRDLSITVTGDLTVDLPEIRGDIRAGGTLTLSGSIFSGTFHGNEVKCLAKQVHCDLLAANKHIEIGTSDLNIERIHAPVIKVHPKAHGRIGTWDSETPLPKDQFPDCRTEGEPEIPIVEALPAEPIPVEMPVPRQGIPDIALHYLKPATQPDGTSRSSTELGNRLKNALSTASQCYNGATPPPEIAEMHRHILNQEFQELRQHFVPLWNGILDYHQQQRTGPNPAATQAFKVIYRLIRTLPETN